MIIGKTYRNIKLFFDNRLIQQLTNEGNKYYPKEYGGLLVGHYSEDNKQLFVTATILPPKFSHSQVYFERNVYGLEEILKQIYHETGDYYVGEWHTHPNASAQYSITDLQAMKSIANTSSVSIINPILLILSIGNEVLLDYQFYFLDEDKLEAYE